MNFRRQAYSASHHSAGTHALRIRGGHQVSIIGAIARSGVAGSGRVAATRPAPTRHQSEPADQRVAMESSAAQGHGRDSAADDRFESALLFMLTRLAGCALVSGALTRLGRRAVLVHLQRRLRRQFLRPCGDAHRRPPVFTNDPTRRSTARVSTIDITTSVLLHVYHADLAFTLGPTSAASPHRHVSGIR